MTQVNFQQYKRINKFKMQKNIKFKNNKEIQDYAAQNKKVLVVYNDYVLDVTTFAHHHPGGAGLILNYQTKDITQKMRQHQTLTLRMADSLVVGTFEKQIRKDIDPQKALMPQIWNMDHETYLRIVDSPHWLFVPSPKMFAFQPFQPLSHNKWWQIYILPLLFISYVFYNTNWEGSNLGVLLSTFLLGVFSFSLTEYLLHRFIFHSEKHLFDNRVIRYLHYVMHGIHHMLPNDPDRLVHPPVLVVIQVILGYFTVYRVIYFENQALNSVFWAGFAIGYLAYDTIHYMLHHVDTSKSKGSYFHRLQQYHNQHHFGGQEAGFGVSSKFWDVIFRTQFKKKFKHGQNLQKIQ